MSEIVLAKEVADQVPIVVQRANALIIATAQDYEAAGTDIRMIKTMRKRIDDTFDDGIDQAHQLHKTLLATKKTFDGPLAMAEATIKNKAAAWSAEQERIRRAEEIRLQEIARRQDEDRRMAEAEALERAGHVDEAAAVIEAPVMAPTIVVPRAVPKVAGMSTRTTWKCRIVNASLIPRQYLIPNETQLGQMARAMGRAFLVPGCEAYEVTGVAASGF